MAKIIKDGRKLKSRIARWTCDSCSSVIESGESEGRRVSDQRDGDAIVTKCPACGHENWIDVSVFDR